MRSNESTLEILEQILDVSVEVQGTTVCVVGSYKDMSKVSVIHGNTCLSIIKKIYHRCPTVKVDLAEKLCLHRLKGFTVFPSFLSSSGYLS